MNEFGFGDGKGHPKVGTLPLDDAEIVLKSADVQAYRVRADCDGEVVDSSHRQTLRDSRVEAGYIKHKKKRRKSRALRAANNDWAESLGCTMEDETALAFGEERLDSGNQIGQNTSSGEGTSQLICTDIVKTTFNI